MSKKIIALFLSVLMILGCMAISVSAADSSALPLSAGHDALEAQFEKGVGPKTNGYSIDYRYYSPVKDGDTEKYPLVIWLHGMGDGAHEGKQIEDYNFVNWSSAEYQARFKDSSGAFLLAPRSVEERLIFWDDSMIEPLRAALDDFIAQNADNIDLTRIYIGGYSMGGKMTLKMAVAYPEMFAAAFPICPAWAITEDYAQYLADMPLWLTSGVTDPLVNYATSVTPTWEKIVAASNNPENLRFSTLSQTAEPNGSSAPSGHHAWIAVANDMFSDTDGDYPYMSTVDGNGNEVTLTFPDGMISWISSFTSDYDGAPGEGSGNIVVGDNLFSLGTIGSIFDMIASFLKTILTAIVKIFVMISPK